MRNSVFICDPQGCGKSKNALKFAERLGVKGVQDWSLGDNFLSKGMLYLTNEGKSEVEEAVLCGGEDITVIEYEKAVKVWL